MHNTTFALVILSLFTSTDKAAGIEGDLLEQARRHGRTWFWFQIITTSLLLFFHQLRADAGRLLLVSYAIYELGLNLSWWVLRPLGYMLRRNVVPAAPLELVRDLLLLPTAFLLGMLIMRMARAHGAQLVLLAGGLVLAREGILDGLPDSVRLALVAVVPALCGAFLMKWLDVRGRNNEAGFPLSRE